MSLKPNRWDLMPECTSCTQMLTTTLRLNPDTVVVHDIAPGQDPTVAKSYVLLPDHDREVVEVYEVKFTEVMAAFRNGGGIVTLYPAEELVN